MFSFVLSLLLITHTLNECAAQRIRDVDYDSDSFKILKYGLTNSNTNITPSEISSGEESRHHNISEMVNDFRTKNSTQATTAEQLKDDLTKFISSKLADALRQHLILLLSSRPLSNIEVNNPKSRGGSKSTEAISSNVVKKSEDQVPIISSYKIPNESEKSDILPSTARHFVFHPYLPYGKDSLPDEKISIHDVLPVKMVKFIKGMVEDAPWEQMFMKMVRMVVDQFVDKIIEAMFTHKEGEDKWRSFDDSLTSRWSLLRNAATSVVRMRRSSGKNKSEKEDDWSSTSFSSSNRLSKDDKHKTKEEPESESWLDSVLDYLFPDDPKAKMDDDDLEFHQRRKRSSGLSLSANNPRMSEILQAFLVKYLELQTEKSAPESMNAILGDSVRYKLLQSISQSKDDSTNVNTPPVTAEHSRKPSNEVHLNILPNTPEQSEPSSILSARWSSLLGGDSHSETQFSEVSKRERRSTNYDGDHEKKRFAFDGFDRSKEAKRLWQASRRSRPSNPKTTDECSLRRACNAGRLLARLPSVQDVTLQLKDYNNEPHWNALLWGMSKKRCSRIFCKRQRSPKGSKHHWAPQENHYYKKSPPTTRSPRLKYEDNDFTTIFSV